MTNVNFLSIEASRLKNISIPFCASQHRLRRRKQLHADFQPRLFRRSHGLPLPPVQPQQHFPAPSPTAWPGSSQSHADSRPLDRRWNALVDMFLLFGTVSPVGELCMTSAEVCTAIGS